MRKVEDCINRKLKHLFGEVVFLVIGPLDDSFKKEYEAKGWRIELIPSLRQTLYILTNNPDLDIDAVKDYDFVVYSTDS